MGTAVFPVEHVGCDHVTSCVELSLVWMTTVACEQDESLFLMSARKSKVKEPLAANVGLLKSWCSPFL